MVQFVQNRRIRVIITTREGLVLDVNAEDSDTPLEVQIATSSTTKPGSNSARVRIVNLSARSRDDLAGAVESSIEQINYDIDVGGIRKLRTIEQQRIKELRSRLTTDGTPKDLAHNRGDAYVELEIGYGERVTRVYEGVTKWVTNSYDGVHWYTDFEIDDGLGMINGGVAIKNFPSNARFLDVATYLVRTLNIGKGNLNEATINRVFSSDIHTFPGGVDLLGQSKQLLDEMFNLSTGEWFIDRMQFYVTKKNEPLPEEPVVVSSESGLRAAPQIPAKNIMQIMTFPRPDIRPGREVTIRGTEKFDGQYRSEQVIHAGSNRTGELGTRVILSQVRTIKL
jgi:hypothetical protein